ncbi:MAG: HAD family phosphatase, partial [Clostridiales bacterium]|nr:HAD family phosphatase [Clostridiales bacterium]
CFKGAEVFLVEGERDVLAPIFPSYAAHNTPVDAVPDFPVVKANVFVDADVRGTQALMERLEAVAPRLGLNTPMAGFMNVVPVGYSKATGIDIICRELDVSLDEVVVFGDADNDLEMLQAVGCPIAMGNAAPQVQAAAARTVADNSHDGAAQAILSCLE